jgi:pimeloyl-ACP methyl ester carboxylesterase
MIEVGIGDYVEIDGLRTFYVKKGTGPALVLVHGGAPGGCARVNWGQNIDFFAEHGFTVFACDQPGFGRTDNPIDYSLEYRYQHARKFIDTLGLSQYSLMGNSQGSYIAARLALEDPRLHKLVLVSSGTLAPRGSAQAEEMSREHSERLAQYVPSLDNMRALTMQTLVNPERVTEELVRERYEMSIGKNLEATQARHGLPAPRPIFQELNRLKIPALLMWGANDSGVALERSLLLFQAIPGAELHVFDRCGHWVQWDQADRFHTIVRDFLVA